MSAVIPYTWRDPPRETIILWRTEELMDQAIARALDAIDEIEQRAERAGGGG